MYSFGWFRDIDLNRLTISRALHSFQVQNDFKTGGKAANLGFPPQKYAQENSYGFYADTCIQLWEYVLKNNVRTYDIELKKAQLRNLRIPCTVLLVDECQDLDGCQVDFVAKQRQFGKYWIFCNIDSE